MSLIMMRFELLRETEDLIEEVLRVSGQGEGTELERARKLKALPELLERVVLYASGVREALEAQQRADDEALATRHLHLVELDQVEHPDVGALAVLCLCGRDRGDHLEEPPHASDEDDAGPVCLGFVPRDRSTEKPICNVPTDPPPAMSAEASP